MERVRDWPLVFVLGVGRIILFLIHRILNMIFKGVITFSPGTMEISKWIKRVHNVIIVESHVVILNSLRSLNILNWWFIWVFISIIWIVLIFSLICNFHIRKVRIINWHFADWIIKLGSIKFCFGLNICNRTFNAWFIY